jgi:hypothetical protein
MLDSPPPAPPSGGTGGGGQRVWWLGRPEGGECGTFHGWHPDPRHSDRARQLGSVPGGEPGADSPRGLYHKPPAAFTKGRDSSGKSVGVHIPDPIDRNRSRKPTPELLACPRRAVQHRGQSATRSGWGPGASKRRPLCHSERSAAMRREVEESRPEGPRLRSLQDAVWRGARGRRRPLRRDPSARSARLHVARDDKVLLARTGRCRNDERRVVRPSPPMTTFAVCLQTGPTSMA